VAARQPPSSSNVRSNLLGLARAFAGCSSSNDSGDANPPDGDERRDEAGRLTVEDTTKSAFDANGACN
jgi:hypothetical protein